MVKLLQILFDLFSGKKTKIISEKKENIQPELLIKKEETVPTNTKIKHSNDGNCAKCEQIFNRYPGFNQILKDWFKDIQKSNPEAHISCAGRGKAEQNEYFAKGTSKAQYGKSSHNYGAAIDIFKLHQTGAEWPKPWFEAIIKPKLDAHNNSGKIKIKWYGMPGSAFFELPHFELAEWRTMPGLKLVEPL